VVCHTGECPKNLLIREAVKKNGKGEGCGKKCKKVRKGCDHFCLEMCHPGIECESEPCKTEVKVKCSCGQREAFVECGAQGEEIQLRVECDKECEKWKRFGKLLSSNKKGYFPASLLKFASQNLEFVKKVENKISHMVRENLDNIEIDVAPRDYQLQKINLYVLLERHYLLETMFYGKTNKPFFVVR
jgi:transcriptional repressor NF-X1